MKIELLLQIILSKLSVQFKELISPVRPVSRKDWLIWQKLTSNKSDTFMHYFEQT